jgi:hypothetical protein
LLLETLEGRALLSHLTPVPRPPAEVAPIPHLVPLSGTTVGSFLLAPVAPGVFSVTSTSSGEITHFGKAILTTHDTTIFTSPTTCIVLDGTATLTAANGDQISLSYSGSAVVDAGKSMDTFTYVVTGGTGRFTDATGSGTVHVVSDLTTLRSILTFDGTISSIGSNKR